MSEPGTPISRRHHTVPKFYLRGFAEGETVLTIALPGDRRFKQSVNDASVETNFYALPGHEAGDDVFEKAMSDVEAAAGSVMQKIGSGTWPLKKPDRSTLAYYIALQAARTQSQRRTSDSMAAQIMRLKIGLGGQAKFRERVKSQVGELSEGQIDELWNQSVRPEGPPVRISNARFVEQIRSIAVDLVPYLAGRPWTLIRFDRRSLVTSDAPVGLVQQPDADPWDGVGYLTAWGITMPLTRKLGLVMGDPMPFADRITVDRVQRGELDTIMPVGSVQMERFLNEQTISHASKWIYLHPADERFIPDELPEPNLVSMQMQGEPWEFNGEPWGRVNTEPKRETKQDESGGSH